jgi:Flp pilus assembly protein TadG
MAHLALSRSETDRKKRPYGHLLRILAHPARFLRGRRAMERCSNSEGQTLVEAALSLAVLFTLVFGMIEMGLVFYTYNFVSEAAREGARYAMTRGSSCTSPCTEATNASVQNYVQNLGYPGLNSSDLTVTTTWPDTGASCTPSVSPCNNPGNNVMVKVTYAFPWSIPFVPSSILTMTSTSEMIIAQ